MYAIFGFCDIHNFNKITMLLQEEVLKFVNTIASIVHDAVHDWGGGKCNKNLGNGFIIVWKIGFFLNLFIYLFFLFYVLLLFGILKLFFLKKILNFCFFKTLLKLLLLIVLF
jgi:hypothetical protein